MIGSMVARGSSCRFPCHIDGEISRRRKDAFRRIYPNKAYLVEVEGFIDVFIERCRSYDMMRDKGVKEPYAWWETHGAACSLLQQLAMRLLL